MTQEHQYLYQIKMRPMLSLLSDVQKTNMQNSMPSFYTEASDSLPSKYQMRNIYADISHCIVFDDLPIFGYRAKVRRYLNNVMRMRKKDRFLINFDQLWRGISPCETFMSIKDSICELIRFEYRWRCPLFVPTDRIEYLMWLRREDLEAVSFWLSVKREFSVDIGDVHKWETHPLSDLCFYVYNCVKIKPNSSRR